MSDTANWLNSSPSPVFNWLAVVFLPIKMTQANLSNSP